VSSRQSKDKASRGIFTPEQRTQAQYALTQQVPQPYPAQSYPESRIPDVFTVRITVMADPHATVATARLYGHDDYTPLMTVTGWSKRDNPDEYSEEIGTAFAVRRALAHLSGKIGRQADGAVRHAESVRAHRAEVKANKDRELQPAKGKHVKKGKHAKAEDAAGT
jgi:hypothetical protein